MISEQLDGKKAKKILWFMQGANGQFSVTEIIINHLILITSFNIINKLMYRRNLENLKSSEFICNMIK
jgi:hypothetical protein